MTNPPPILSFLTGDGFMDMGFENAGFPIVWTDEIDPAFSSFYSVGFSSWKNNSTINSATHKISNNHSIKEIKAETIITDAFNGHKPKFFGIIGRLSCQDFSINGNVVLENQSFII